jgi:hypothetical protein
LLKESLARNLGAILVKEEMLPRLPVAAGAEILILLTIEAIKTTLVDHLVAAVLARVDLTIAAIEDLLILPQRVTEFTLHQCGIVVRLVGKGVVAASLIELIAEDPRELLLTLLITEHTALDRNVLINRLRRLITVGVADGV